MPCMKGIGVMTGESATLRATMDEAVARGIAVTQSGDCPADIPWVCMATDFYNAGAAVAQELAKRLNNKGNVVVSFGLPGDVNQKRQDGLQDWFTKNAPNMKVIGVLRNCDDVQGTVTCAEEAVAKYPEMNAYYSTGLLCAVGPYSVFPKAGRKDVIITAVDDTPETLAAIRAGANAFTYVQQPYGQGYLQVYIPWLMVHKNVKPTGLKNNFLDTRITIVDKTNIDTYTDTQKKNFAELKTYVETVVMK
jgi:inositol transport system substrate-binding protein